MNNPALPRVRRRAIKWSAALMAMASLLLLMGCASTPRPAKAAPEGTPSPIASPMIGIASYYGKQYHGRKTASGEIYDMNKMTAAHRTLPFGVNVRVTELSSNRSVIVRINDRGPFAPERIIDVSLAAARHLGIVQSGHAKVRVEVASHVAARQGFTQPGAGPSP